MPLHRNDRYRAVGFFIAGLLIFDGIVWSLILSPHASAHSLALYFLDIGQGDSELIRLPNGAAILIDGGPPNGALLKELSKVLPADDTYIDLVMMTHPQLDHFGGFVDLLKKYDVGMFIGSGRKGEIAAYAELEKALRSRRVGYMVLAEGDQIRSGVDTLSLLGPSTGDLLSGELNDTCLVALLREGEFRALYTGDIGSNVEHELVQKYNLASQVLKVGHHGSRFSSSDEFLSQVTPKVSIIEVGAKNTYGHPTKEALDRLTASGTKTFRTDQNGTVKVVFDGENIEVLTEKGTVNLL